VEGQVAWRVRHLLALALCQLSSEGGKPEEHHAAAAKSLGRAMELATAAGLQQLRVRHSTLRQHVPLRHQHACPRDSVSLCGLTRFMPGCLLVCVDLLQQEVLVLQTHVQSLQAARAAQAKAGPGGSAAAASAGAAKVAAAPTAAAAKAGTAGTAAAGKRKAAGDQGAAAAAAPGASRWWLVSCT
jgi:hypothetical protein